MPALSKAQFGFMGAVASGKTKAPGLSPEKAKEFLRGVNPAKLPARIGTKPTMHQGFHPVSAPAGLTHMHTKSGK